MSKISTICWSLLRTVVMRCACIIAFFSCNEVKIHIKHKVFKKSIEEQQNGFHVGDAITLHPPLRSTTSKPFTYIQHFNLIIYWKFAYRNAHGLKNVYYPKWEKCLNPYRQKYTLRKSLSWLMYFYPSPLLPFFCVCLPPIPQSTVHI